MVRSHTFVVARGTGHALRLQEVKAAKEAIWLADLEVQFKELGWNTCRNINFTHNNKNSEIDLLVIDRRERFAVGLELKWLTQPDSASETRGFEAEIQKGIQEQARPAADWMRSRRQDLAARLSLSPAELDDVEFRSAVLVRPAFGTGLTYDHEVPVLNGDPLESMVQAYGPSLRTIWRVAQRAKFIPIEGVNFERVDREYHFGDIRFVAEGFGAKSVNHWGLRTALERAKAQLE